MQENLDMRVLAALEPISSFSPARLRELLEYCQLEMVAEGADPFAARPEHGQSVYLLQGTLELSFEDGNHVVIQADSEWARHPIGKRQPKIVSSRAQTEVQLLRIEDELLDRMVTWDQFAHKEAVGHGKEKPESPLRKLLQSGMFSAENLSYGPFARLPAANIGKLLECVEAIGVWDKEVVIHEGDDGDYYYLIESGRAQVSRLVDGVPKVLAELKPGDVFGEEALISDSKRNATVTMKSNGVLLRLNKQDFQALMQEPLLQRVSYAEAQDRVAKGAQWLDVRHPPEYRHDKLPGAINIPLHEIRGAMASLNKAVPYVVYCQSGSRSAAAAFILAQAGYEVSVLAGGLWSVAKEQENIDREVGEK